VCLLGFSDFERRALAMQFGLVPGRVPSYALVVTLQEARFLVVDADAKAAVQRIFDAGRLTDTVFVGSTLPPGGVLACLRRPIDALSLLRELDAAVQRLHGPAAAVLAPRAPAAPAAAPPTATALPRIRALARPTTPKDPQHASAPGLLDSQLSELADLFPDRAPSAVALSVVPVAARAVPVAASAAAPAAPTAKTPKAPDTRCDALLVDDSEIALKFLELKLGELGLRSRTVTDSDAALAQLEHHDFNYVFLDVELGQGSRMDGLALCRHIKRMRRDNRPPVIAMVSAHASQTDRVRGSLAGCDAYLGKPLAAADLMAVVSLRRGR
jgi:CheY-like chemotaxis protein